MIRQIGLPLRSRGRVDHVLRSGDVGTYGPAPTRCNPFPPTNLTVYLGTDPTSRKVQEVKARGDAVLVYQRVRDRACVV